MVSAPLARLARGSSVSTSSSPGLLTPLTLAVSAGIQRLDFSLDPRRTLAKVRNSKPTIPHVIQVTVMLAIWVYTLWIIKAPVWFKLFLVAAYTTAGIIPLSNQFIWPATPVLTWVILFFSARYIPPDSRPGIHVALLPALESVMYGANISDLQTRFTHPLLDILAWLPYGVLHFTLPVVIAIVLWLFGPRNSVQYWGKAFGWMNVLGVMTQIVLPCAAPCESTCLILLTRKGMSLSMASHRPTTPCQDRRVVCYVSTDSSTLPVTRTLLGTHLSSLAPSRLCTPDAPSSRPYSYLISSLS